jgi:hypothetical protein
VGLAQVARDDDQLAVARAIKVGGEFHATIVRCASTNSDHN